MDGRGDTDPSDRSTTPGTDCDDDNAASIRIDDPRAGIGDDWSIGITDSTDPTGLFGTYDISQVSGVNGLWSASCNP